MSAGQSENEPPACECGGTTWMGIPDSLAVACESCGRVLVENTDGSSWERGPSLQEWAADLSERKRGDLHVWTHDGDDFVIAASPEDADAAMVEHGGSVVDPIEWQQLPDDRLFTADLDDGNGAVKKTCAAWARERGRGYFCTANY